MAESKGGTRAAKPKRARKSTKTPGPKTKAMVAELSRAAQPEEAAKSRKAEEPKKVPEAAMVSNRLPQLVTSMSEAQIVDMMERCSRLQIDLKFLLLRLLIEQKERAHERRMAQIRHLGSTVAYVPVAIISGIPKAAPVVAGFFARLFGPKKKGVPQEAASS